LPLFDDHAFVPCRHDWAFDSTLMSFTVVKTSEKCNVTAHGVCG